MPDPDSGSTKAPLTTVEDSSKGESGVTTVTTTKEGFDDDNLTLTTTPSTDFDVMPAVPGMEDNDPVRNLALKWTLLYNAQDSFKVKDLTPASMFEAYKVMVEDRESQVFTSYFYHNTGGHRTGECNETCWRGHLCAISHLIVEDVSQCVNSSDPDTFYKTKSALPLETTMKPLVTESPTTLTASTEQQTIPTVIDHNENNHSHDSEDDHDEIEEVDVTITSQTTGHKQDSDVKKEKMENTGSSVSAVGIFVGIVLVALVILGAIFGYKRYRDNRYRNQEFLLTDSVFRYDGYSQLDDA